MGQERRNMVESQAPLRGRYVLEAVRQLANDAGIYRINPGHPDAVNLSEMYDYWREGHISIGTFGVDVDELFPDLSSGDTITSGQINPAYRDSVTGHIDQDELTTLLQSHSSDGAPGRAAGSLDRFFNELTAGTGILGNMEGTAAGVVEGPAVYKRDGPAAKAGPTHYFVRPVTWAKAPSGGILEISHSDLPAPLRPNPTTCTRVQNASSLLELTSLVGFFAEQSIS